jgi:hypothetical protein
VTLAELIAKLKELGITPGKLAAEMGWTFDQVAGEMGGEAHATLHKRADAYTTLAEKLGVDPAKPESVVAAAEKIAADAAAGRTRAHAELVAKVVGEKVKNEKARGLITRLVKLEEGADEATVAKAVDTLLEEEDVKALAGEMSAPSARPGPTARGGTSGEASHVTIGADKIPAGLVPTGVAL